MDEKHQNFQHIMLYYFNKGKRQLKCKKKKKRFVLWLIECVESGLASFMLEICHWTNDPWLGRPVEVDRNQTEALTENN